MKATIEFQLPDEQVEFESAANGSKAIKSLYDFDMWLLAQKQHEGKESLTINHLHRILRETMEDNGFHFEKMFDGLW